MIQRALPLVNCQIYELFLSVWNSRGAWLISGDFDAFLTAGNRVISVLLIVLTTLSCLHSD